MEALNSDVVPHVFLFCFRMCNRLPEMLKNGDAGIFPVYYSLKGVLSSELIRTANKCERLPAKNTPRGEQTSYALYYSLNKLVLTTVVFERPNWRQQNIAMYSFCLRYTGTVLPVCQSGEGQLGARSCVKIAVEEQGTTRGVRVCSIKPCVKTSKDLQETAKRDVSIYKKNE